MSQRIRRYTVTMAFRTVCFLVAVIFATVAACFLNAPAAWHRMLFRRGQRPKILQVANSLAVAGVACLAIAMTATVLLIFAIVAGPLVASAFAVLVAAVFGVLWFLLPLRGFRLSASASRD